MTFTKYGADEKTIAPPVIVAVVEEEKDTKKDGDKGKKTVPEKS